MTSAPIGIFCTEDKRLATLKRRLELLKAKPGMEGETLADLLELIYCLTIEHALATRWFPTKSVEDRAEYFERKGWV